jgi:flagella basal body P-ring formation protein FlgA
MMNAGDIVWRGSLVREKAIQRGELVRVVSGEGNWSVSVQAKTEQDGFLGDTVNLRNVQTNKLISGRVIGRGEVEVQ